MKPAAFDYIAPREVEHVLALLAQYGDDAKLLAGGQSLGPMLNLRIVTPAVIIDINRVAELHHYDTRSGLILGSGVRQSTLEDDAQLAITQPLVAAVIPHIAHRPIRNRGTVGGSLAHADPAAEWGALVLALDGELLIAHHTRAVRRVHATEFFTGMLTTSLRADELLLQVRLPPWPQTMGHGFAEVARRHGDFALVAVACRLAVDAAGRCTAVRLALNGADDRPMRALRAESMLDGEVPQTPLFEAAAAIAAQDSQPLSDLHASAVYRRRLLRIVVLEVLQQALSRALSQTLSQQPQAMEDCKHERSAKSSAD